MIYADSSALAKLVIEEPETIALRRYVRRQTELSTSELAIVELGGAFSRAFPGEDFAARVEAVLAGVLLVGLERQVLEAAAAHAGVLRALDAIHLASALTVGATEMLVYDRRLAQAARGAGISVLAPR